MNESDFPEIKTGNGIDRDSAATTNDRLKKTVIELGKLGGSIVELEKKLIGLNEQSDRIQRWILRLTFIAVLIGVVGLFL